MMRLISATIGRTSRRSVSNWKAGKSLCPAAGSAMTLPDDARRLAVLRLVAALPSARLTAVSRASRAPPRASAMRRTRCGCGRRPRRRDWPRHVRVAAPVPAHRQQCGDVVAHRAQVGAPGELLGQQFQQVLIRQCVDRVAGTVSVDEHGRTSKCATSVPRTDRVSQARPRPSFRGGSCHRWARRHDMIGAMEKTDAADDIVRTAYSARSREYIDLFGSMTSTHPSDRPSWATGRRRSAVPCSMQVAGRDSGRTS